MRAATEDKGNAQNTHPQSYLTLQQPNCGAFIDTWKLKPVYLVFLFKSLELRSSDKP
jgi:hypothetical protein